MRFQYLEQAYRRSEANRQNEFNEKDIQADLNWTDDQLNEVAEYFVGEGLVKYESFGGVMGITHQGIVAYEGAISHLDTRTDYFPPVNVINTVHNVVHVGQMHHSNIQQGAPGSTQTVSVINDSVDWNGLRSLIPELRASLDALPDAARTAVAADLATVEAQASAPEPRSSVVRECLSLLKSVFEKAGGAVLATKITAWMQSAGWLQSPLRGGAALKGS